ncbi:MAG: DUF1643 domain-containing protein [Luminiphilus sp.]|nr:DUF1643 domain-containing protein [Luminiphilus sp.]
MQRSAGLSRCKGYRYWLQRRWGDGPEIIFVGLNPSTADAKADDPTLRRIIRFSDDWGYSAVTVINLFAWRGQHPRKLCTVQDPVGPRNNYWIKKLTQGIEPVVAAWGNGGSLQSRDQYLIEKIPGLYCLGKTQQGHPRHPLYAPASCRLIRVDKAAR